MIKNSWDEIYESIRLEFTSSHCDPKETQAYRDAVAAGLISPIECLCVMAFADEDACSYHCSMNTQLALSVFTEWQLRGLYRNN